LKSPFKEGVFTPSYFTVIVFLVLSSFNFGIITSKTPLSLLASIFSISALSGRVKLLENLPKYVSTL